jgi:RNA polymerase sigma factor (sigma-70 family)
MNDPAKRKQPGEDIITTPALTLDNPEFILLLKAKNNDAWDLVIDRYAKTLHNDVLQSLTKRGLRTDHAGDIEQQIWVSALVKIDTFVWQDKDKFYHWLRSIATQHVLTLAHRMKRSSVSLDEMEDVMEGVLLDIILYRNGLIEDKPEDRLTLYESLSLLDDALHELNPRMREIVVRRYLLNETPRDMAVVYNVKPETISIILNRAKKILRSYLESNNYGPE